MAIKKLTGNETLEELRAWAIETEEEYNTLNSANDIIKKEKETLSKTISDLQLTNQKLYLRLTDNTHNTQQKEDKKVDKKLSDNDISNLFK